MNITTVSPTVGLPTIVTIVFVVLKLIGVIAWSWWWVLAPLWIGFGLAIVGLIIGAIAAAIFLALDL